MTVALNDAAELLINECGDLLGAPLLGVALNLSDLSTYFRHSTAMQATLAVAAGNVAVLTW